MNWEFLSEATTVKQKDALGFGYCSRVSTVFNRFDDLEKGFKGGNVMLSLTVEEEVEDETVLYIYI